MPEDQGGVLPAPNKTQEETLITKILRSRLAQKGAFWNRRFPTLLGLFILTLSLTLTLLLFRQGHRWRLKAHQAIIPQEVQITNVSGSSFTVSWLTDSSTSGSVSWGTTPLLDQVTLDDRDAVAGEVKNYFTHHVTLFSLMPATQYYFKINSGQKTFGQNGNPFAFTTPALSTSPPAVSDPAYGQVFRPDTSPAEGAIVYLTLKGGSTLSTLVKSSGSWLIPLNNTLASDLTSYLDYPKRGGEVEIFVQGGPEGGSKVTTLTGLEKPLPPITLGRDYSFEDLPPAVSPPPSPAPPPAPAPSPKPEIVGDLNGDGVVNAADLAILRSNWGENPQEPRADLNGDGVVNTADLAILQNNWTE